MKCKVTVNTSHYPKEVPWEVPEGWVWCRLEDIAYVATGSTPDKSCFVSNGIPYIKMYNVRNQQVDFDYSPQYINSATHYGQLKRSILYPGDLLMNIVGPPLGKLAIIPDSLLESNTNQAAVVIRPYLYKSVINNYLFYYLEEMSEINSIATKGSAGQVNISLTQSQSMRIPLPPLEEQQQIIYSIQKWLDVVAIIKDGSADLANNINKAKGRVLDLAIHGKLVPQDPSDEPAIELLKRINPEFVPSDNLHYEAVLPDGWTLVQLSSICSTINGLWKGTKEPLVKVGVIRNANFTKDFTLDYSKIEYINVELKSFAKRNLEDGDIIVEKSGGSDNFPVGRSILYLGENNMYSFSNFTMSLRITDKQKILPKYLFYVLQHRYRRGDMKQMQTHTTGLHNLLTDIYLSILIPIPPVREQKRIVEAIEDSFRVIDGGIRDIVNDTK